MKYYNSRVVPHVICYSTTHITLPRYTTLTDSAFIVPGMDRSQEIVQEIESNKDTLSELADVTEFYKEDCHKHSVALLSEKLHGFVSVVGDSTCMETMLKMMIVVSYPKTLGDSYYDMAWSSLNQCGLYEKDYTWKLVCGKATPAEVVASGVAAAQKLPKDARIFWNNAFMQATLISHLHKGIRSITARFMWIRGLAEKNDQVNVTTAEKSVPVKSRSAKRAGTIVRMGTRRLTKSKSVNGAALVPMETRSSKRTRRRAPKYN